MCLRIGSSGLNYLLLKNRWLILRGPGLYALCGVIGKGKNGSPYNDRGLACSPALPIRDLRY
jgi:hypothetical protein